MTVKHKTTGLGTKVTTTVWDEDHEIKDVIPDATTTYDLGSNSKVWVNAFLATLKDLADIYAFGSHYVCVRQSDSTARAFVLGTYRRMSKYC